MNEAAEPGAGSPPELLREGETCWRTAQARRAAVLVDGEAYFSAVADAIERARESLWLIGWDFHSAVKLRRGSDARDPSELVPLLEAQVRAQPELHVRVLAWDFFLLYALEREPLPLVQFGARTHRRIHFAMDSSHPLGASQHQKLVVVDDALAFVGGFDLTSHRWDTREHRPVDPRRARPSGSLYSPFHDVQAAVDGEAAAAVGAIARERWLRATGEKIDPTAPGRDPWPPELEPRFRGVRVALARTQPCHAGAPEVREVEALYRESIAAARRWIYVENQYLSAQCIGDWLAERLREPDGPEIVLVGPQRNSGWLEDRTMGALRDRIVRQLRAADPGDRLRALYPHVEGLAAGEILNVHAKLMIADDQLLRIGSSNLSNRSLGLDSECDLAIWARGEARVANPIAATLEDLLAEHLGTSAARVHETLERTGSLVQTVDALSVDTPAGAGGRTLRPLELDVSDATAEAMQEVGAFDPEHPVPLEELVERFYEDAPPARSGRAAWSFLASLGALAALALLWRATPIGEWVSAERMGEMLALMRESAFGPPLAAALFTALCVLMVPVTALTLATGVALGPLTGVAVAWSGSVAAAAIGHWAGGWLWRDTVRRLAGPRLNTLSERLGRRGILASAALRFAPVAPFMVVNLAAGASHVRPRDFVLGTAIGMLPGAVLLVVAGDRAAAWLASPRAWLGLGVAALAVAAAVFAWSRLRRRRAPEPASS